VPIFEYKAIDGENKVKKGIIDADTPRDARLKLKKERLFVTDIQESGGKRKATLRIRGVTGVDAPYEPPTAPDLRLDTGNCALAPNLDTVVALLRRRGMLD